MKNLLLIFIILSAFACQDEPQVKSRFEEGKVYSKEEVDIMFAVDPLPPGWCMAPGGGGYVIFRC